MGVRSDRDLYRFMAVFHGFGDGQAERVPTTLWQAFGERRPVTLAVDTVAEPVGIDPAMVVFDMRMSIGTRGRGRTRAEWEMLFRRAGFAVAALVVMRTLACLSVIRLVQPGIAGKVGDRHGGYSPAGVSPKAKQLMPMLP